MHSRPFVLIYYDIKRRTITPFSCQICRAFVIGFKIGVVSVIVNPNIEDETVESLGLFDY